MRPKWVGVFLTAAVAGCWAGPGAEAPRTNAEKRAALDEMIEGVRAQFPDVERLSAGEVARLHADDAVVLVDVRTEAERGVSRIPGSVSAADFLADPDRFGDRPVVAYCTVGYRSAQFVREMAEQGRSVVNMEGSMLAWTHGGGELVDDAGSTRRLHVYGAQWDLAADGYESTW